VPRGELVGSGKISERVIGALASASRRRTIEATGLVVAPGFIDLLVGSSIPRLLDPQSPT
jgi:dihydroorotase-like cyclic amidohydrolase